MASLSFGTNAPEKTVTDKGSVNLNETLLTNHKVGRLYLHHSVSSQAAVDQRHTRFCPRFGNCRRFDPILGSRGVTRSRPRQIRKLCRSAGHCQNNSRNNQRRLTGRPNEKTSISVHQVHDMAQGRAAILEPLRKQNKVNPCPHTPKPQ